MEIKYYVGVEEACIKITRTTDIYTLLDWLQGEMIEKSENANGSINVKKWEAAADFISELMELTEKKGFGNIPVFDLD